VPAGALCITCGFRGAVPQRHNPDARTEELPAWRAETEELQAQLEAEAIALSAARRAAAARLRTAVEAGLQQLAMEASRFDVRIGWDAVMAGRYAGNRATLQVGEAATHVGALRSH
jgi:DNA repair ATPase RecN